MTQVSPGPGWYPAPHAGSELRFWDGSRWHETPAPESSPSPRQRLQRSNPLAVVALVFSIVGTIFACFPGAYGVGWILLPAAFVMAVVATALPARRKAAAISGLVVAVLGTVAGFIVFSIALSTAMAGLSGSIAPRQPESTLAAPAGFNDSGDGIAYRFIENGECEMFRCARVEVVALRDCPTAVYVEANTLDAQQRVVGMTNDMVSALRAGERAILDIVAIEDDARSFRLTDFSCY